MHKNILLSTNTKNSSQNKSAVSGQINKYISEVTDILTYFVSIFGINTQ